MTLILSSFTQSASAQSWWNDFYIEARDSAIEGIPISEINDTWEKASAFKKEQLGESEQRYLQSYAPNARFSYESDINEDKKEDKIIIGGYLSKSGEVGSFFLILSQEADGQWKKALLEEIAGKANFSALIIEAGLIYWTHCFECDTYSYLEVKNNRFILTPHSCCDEL